MTYLFYNRKFVPLNYLFPITPSPLATTNELAFFVHTSKIICYVSHGTFIYEEKKNAIRKLNSISYYLSREIAKHLEALTYHLSDKTRGLTIQGKLRSQKEIEVEVQLDEKILYIVNIPLKLIPNGQT